jgi:CDP-alcohol phosphatidyltransferase
MIGRPTLAELRSRVFKHSAHHARWSAAAPEIGNWLARRLGRPSAVYGTWLAVRLGLSANQVTTAAVVAGLGSAAAIGTGARVGFVAGAGLAILAYWLDHVDGQVARWRGTASLNGVYLDYLMHHASSMALGFALGHGLAVRTGASLWSVAGFAVALGWGFLNLQNDCRYKAFFQRLKRETVTYRIDGGAGGRPEPPAPWPQRGRGLITWPAFKACEPHVVLVGLTFLANIAIVAPQLWVVIWKFCVVGMACLAPLLAAGRVARVLSKGSIETEFDRWFQRDLRTPTH